MGMLMIEKFDLDLPKTGDDMALGVEDDHAVVDEFEERGAIAGVKNLRGPIGAYGDLGDEALSADERRDDIDESGWNGADRAGEEWQSNFVAGCGWRACDR